MFTTYVAVITFGDFFIITVTVAFTFDAIYYIWYWNSPVNESLEDLLVLPSVSSYGAGLERIFNQ